MAIVRNFLCGGERRLEEETAAGQRYAVHSHEGFLIFPKFTRDAFATLLIRLTDARNRHRDDIPHDQIQQLLILKQRYDIANCERLKVPTDFTYSDVIMRDIERQLFNDFIGRVEAEVIAILFANALEGTELDLKITQGQSCTSVRLKFQNEEWMVHSFIQVTICRVALFTIRNGCPYIFSIFCPFS